MKKNIQLILSFNKCAPCLNNFLDLFCHSTCSPYQNQFLKITKTSKADKEFDKSQTKLQVDAIIYSITLDSVNTFFNSCSKASSSALGSSFLDFFPSSNGPELLYAIQSNSPFGIDFNLFDGDRTFHLVRSIPDDEDSKLIERDVPRINEPITPDFKDCDQASRNNETCRCAQCAKLDCPVVPGVIEPTTCTLFGVLSCCSLAIAVVYILLLLASVVFFVMYLRRRSKPGKRSVHLGRVAQLLLLLLSTRKFRVFKLFLLITCRSFPNRSPTQTKKITRFWTTTRRARPTRASARGWKPFSLSYLNGGLVSAFDTRSSSFCSVSSWSPGSLWVF